MEATPRPWRVRNNSGRHHEYFIESDSSRWSIADNIVEKDAALIVKAVNSHQSLVDALNQAQGDINWMLNNGRFLNPYIFDYIDKALKNAGENTEIIGGTE